ncbi:MAG: bifunctional uroporphyrinogen-III C-methyltransferase/uroporphyrinogen-III synthase [Actinobacteria bacterium]|nr:bifunctional uroporphyrinogen-III C-methyltransferase/uroporphyrinogen-III synthase [Actinomycetota bacterium]
MSPAKEEAQSMSAVSLIASGPGDPDLMTVRASELLRHADIVICDADIVELAKATAGPDTEIEPAVDANGLPLTHSARAQRVAEEHDAGRRVVRLLSGDPVLDGALHIEVQALNDKDVPFEVVPGVSVVNGVPAYAGFGLTGGGSREVAVLDGADPDLDWSTYARSRVTLVIQNGAERAAALCHALIAAGRAESTPVAVTRAGCTIDQRTSVSTLAELPAVLKASKLSGPGLMVVGDVVLQRNVMSWFETKPLFGWRVLVPRTKEQAASLSDQLRSYGAVPVEVPTISVEPPRTPQQMDRAVQGLVTGRYEWVVFTSTNAVRAVCSRFSEYGLDARSFAGLKVAAIGEQTAAALRAFGVSPDLIPAGEQSSMGLLEEWPDYDSLVDPINRVFLPRADIATETLVAGMQERGWEVDDITAYRTVRASPPPAEIREAIKTGGFDAVLFTSSSTVRNLIGIAGKPHAVTSIACIGPQTAKTAEEHGLNVDVLASSPSVAQLAADLAEHGDSLRLAALEAGEVSWRPSRRRPASRRKAT